MLDDFFLYDYNIQSAQEVNNRNMNELNVAIVAEAYTKIKTAKTLANGISPITLDSIQCASNIRIIHIVTL